MTKNGKEKKYPCPDCKFCQWCDDSRCRKCRPPGWDSARKRPQGTITEQCPCCTRAAGHKPPNEE